MTFRDQSHIDRVREALWSPAGEGASVLVGSGLSRNAPAARSGASGPPLLGELVNGLARALYPEPKSAKGASGAAPASGFGAVERLAMEYETAFGRSRLHEFLRNEIRDLDFSPSEIHERLLRLPWRDVFTTNWDTLLERTRVQVPERAYSVIVNMDEIPLAKRPRIVKLHGSFPAQFPLILSEEDYRTYPVKFAPFVNFVQQAMMETVMCLIGFSGDDPNFLHWSGWVRDNLGPAAPKIYLIGWLDLSPHRRRMLEDRNVAPIDLAHHPNAPAWPEAARHRNAVEWTLHALERGRPYNLADWPLPAEEEKTETPDSLAPLPEPLGQHPLPEVSPSESSDLLGQIRQTVQTWGHNRRLFPGWLILPEGEQRRELLLQTRQWEERILNCLDELEPAEKFQAVYELIWRHEQLLEAIPSALESAAEAVLSSVNCQERTIDEVPAQTDWIAAREAWRFTEMAQLTAARHKLDQELFERRLNALTPFLEDEEAVKHRVGHERCLWAALQLRVGDLESLLDEWPLEVCDPAWKIRKAALLWEVNRGADARGLLREALDEIRSGEASGETVAGASREGWALLLEFRWENRHGIRSRHKELARLKCDASSEIESIAEELRLSDGSEDPPMFDLGVKRRTVRFSNIDPEARALRAVRATEVAGLPPVTRHEDLGEYDVSAALLCSAATHLASDRLELAVRLVLRASGSHSDETLNRVVSRTRLAVLSSESVHSLVETCVDFIREGMSRTASPSTVSDSWFWETRLQVAIEVLSRLVLRAEQSKTEEILDLALDCYRSPHFLSGHTLRIPVRNLLSRTWEALQSDRRRARALELWEAPIAGLGSFSERGTELYTDPVRVVPAPWSELNDARGPDNERRWELAIRQVLDGLLAGNSAREIAFERLVPLAFVGILRTDEAEQIASALWIDNAPLEDGLPKISTGYFDLVFLVLPEPTPGAAEQSFRQKWLSEVSSGAETSSEALKTLTQVGQAIKKLRERGHAFSLSDRESASLIETLRTWAESPVPKPVNNAFGLPGARGEIEALVGLKTVLLELTVPTEVADAVFQRAKKLAELGTGAFRLAGPLSRLVPERAAEIENWIGAGLVSDKLGVAGSAVVGLHEWTEEAHEEQVTAFPSPTLVREVGNIIADRRASALHQALQFATWLFEHDCQEDQQLVLPLALQGLS